MKRFLYLSLAALTVLAVSCKKDNNNNGDEPTPGPGPGPGPSVYTELNGGWTMEEEGMMRYFISFDCDVEENHVFIRDLGKAAHFHDNVVYGAGEMDGEMTGYAKINITADQILIPIKSNGQPEDGRWEEIPEVFTRDGNTLKASWSISGKVLTIADVELSKIERFEEAPYATISTTLEGNEAFIGAAATVVKIPFTVTPALPWCTVTAIRDRSMLLADATITSDENEISVSIPAGTEGGYGVVSLQTEGANDLNVRINRKIGRAIIPSVTQVTQNYKYADYADIIVTIVNPMSTYRLDARADDSSANWMNAYFSSEGGNKYKLHYHLEENNTGASRSGKLTLSYTDSYGSGEPAPEVTITVTQTYDAPAFTFTPASASVSFLGEEVSIPLTIANARESCWFDAGSNDSWIQNVRVDTEWVEPEEGSGEEFTEDPVESGHYAYTLRFTAGQNESTTPRSGTIYIKYTKYYEGVLTEVSYTVNQTGLGPIITLYPEEMTVDFHYNYNMSFRYRIDYGSDNETFTPDVDWLHYSRHEWNNDGETKTAYFLIMDDNLSRETRVGHIRVADGSSYKDFTVTQTGIQSAIVVEQDEMTFDYNHQNPGIPFRLIENPNDWPNVQGSSNVDWMRPIRSYHNSYSIEIEDNNTGATREGILTLTLGSEVSRVKIIQTYTAPEIRIDNPNYSTDYTAKNGVFLHCVVAWSRMSESATYESSADWVQTMAVTNGVQLSFSENKTNITRSAVITVRYLDVTATINVTQGIRAWFDFGVGFQIAACNVGATSGEQAGTYAKWADAPSKITEGRLPTNQEWFNFARALTWTWEPRNGVNGCVGRPNNEAYAGIEYFIPAVGYYNTSGTLMYSGSYGYYWTSGNDTSFPQTAWVAVCSDALSRKVDTGNYININNKATFRAVK